MWHLVDHDHPWRSISWKWIYEIKHSRGTCQTLHHESEWPWAKDSICLIIGVNAEDNGSQGLIVREKSNNTIKGKTTISPFTKSLVFPPLKNRDDHRTQLLGWLCPSTHTHTHTHLSHLSLPFSCYYYGYLQCENTPWIAEPRGPLLTLTFLLYHWEPTGMFSSWSFIITEVNSRLRIYEY